MSVREVLFIFHYGGDFELDISRPVYNGGKQKTRYLATDITFESLVKEAIEASNGDSSSIQNISIQYLHHNGRAFSMASIDDDIDVRSMFKASGDESNGIYLYVFNGRNEEQCLGGDNWRFQRSSVRRPFTGKSKNSSGTSLKKQGLNSTSCGYVPTIDIREDKDMYFPFVRVDCSPRQTDGQDTIDDDLVFGTNRSDDIHLDGPPFIGQIHSIPMSKAESTFEGANQINEALDCNETPAEVVGANPLNESFRCNETPAIDLEDKMDPWDINTNVGNNSAREMWIGRGIFWGGIT